MDEQSEFQRYLLPVAEGRPAGVDLDDVGTILALDQMLAWPRETQPEWQKIRTSAEEALLHTRDLRVAVCLAAALLHLDGLPGFCRGVRLIRGLTEAFWDSMYPTLEEDGSADVRSNTLCNLSSYYKVIRPLRTLPLVEHRVLGRFSALDVDIAEQRVPIPIGYEKDPPQIATIESVFREADLERLGGMQKALLDAVEDLEVVSALFAERAPRSDTPDFERLFETLRRSAAILGARLPAAANGAVEPGGPMVETRPVGAAPVAAPVGEIGTRADAIKALEAASRYFARCEPSSPVPLLLQRAKRLADMDFLSIVADVAPDALAGVKQLGGIGRDDA